MAKFLNLLLQVDHGRRQVLDDFDALPYGAVRSLQPQDRDNHSFRREDRMPGEITNYVTPTQLFRYRSFRRYDAAPADVLQRELAAIRKGYIWAATYNEMNDPMEGTFYASRQDPVDSNFRNVLREMREGKEQTGIACFSETPTNELMWAHYADEFRGICIAYDFERLRNTLQPLTVFARLFYTENPPRLRLGGAGLEADIRRVLSSKSQKWGYEREWRMFTRQRGKILYEDLAAVRTIYLGHRINPEVREKIRRLARRMEISCSKMNLDGYRVGFDNTEDHFRI